MVRIRHLDYRIRVARTKESTWIIIPPSPKPAKDRILAASKTSTAAKSSFGASTTGTGMENRTCLSAGTNKALATTTQFPTWASTSKRMSQYRCAGKARIKYL